MTKVLKPLTEEQKYLVRNYFETGEQGGWTESQIRFTYGRMRAHGERIPVAEKSISAKKQKEKDYYKLCKERELKEGLDAYFREHNQTTEYDFIRLNRWENGRSLIVGISEYDKDKFVHTHVTEIFEAENPEYFKECICKYAPEQALPTDKI